MDTTKYGITTVAKQVFVTPDGREHKTVEEAIENIICDEMNKVFWKEFSDDRDVSVYRASRAVYKHWNALVEIMRRHSAMKE